MIRNNGRMPGLIRHCFTGFVFCAAVCLLAAQAPKSSSASEGTLPPEVQKVLSQLLEMRDPTTPLPEKAALDAFLAYTTSPLNLTAVGEKTPYPAKQDKATGVLWRSKVNVPLRATLQYLYNPKIPGCVVYPASIRLSHWLPGSDILSLSEPLWDMLFKDRDKPTVLRGTEFEEITPDTFSGSYYSYELDRVLILTEYDGCRMMISLGWQKGRSGVGKKAAVIGKYEDWDFVYSGAPGTLAKGIGWADTYIYTSANCTVFYEDAPGGKMTGYALYRWMDAGWSGLNMVKDHHIVNGAERSFSGLKAFMESPKRPGYETILSYIQSLEALDVQTLRERFLPYSVKVEEAAATVPALQTEDFQKVIKNAGYGNSLSKDELVAAMSVNFLKEQLGMPLLAGPLNGDRAQKNAPAAQ